MDVRIKLSGILLLLFIAMTVRGQEYGVKAGGMVSYLTGIDNIGVTPGGQLGGFVKLGGDEPLYFKAELLLSQKGARTWGTANSLKVDLLYLELALMFGIKLSDALHMNLGFQPSMFLYGRYSSGGDSRNINNSHPSGAAEFDYSTFVGLEYNFNENIFLGLRYNHSFVPIVKYNNSIFENERTIISRVGQIYIGYYFRN